MTDEASPRSGVSALFVSDGDSFAPAGSVPPIPRRRQPLPTHCGAPRRNGRDLIIATRPAHPPLPSLLSAAAAQAVQAIPEPTTIPAAPIPRSQHRQICTCPPRAKGPLDRRSKWFSLVTFFLQKKKVTRAGARNAPSRARRRNTCSPPGQRPRASAFSVSDGPISSNSGRNGGKNAGRNYISALPRALCLFTATRAFPHVTGVFLIVVVPPTVPAQLSAAAARYYGKKHSFCCVAG